MNKRNSELLFGAATALSNQWSESWIKKLERLGKQFQSHENSEPVGDNRDEFLAKCPDLEEPLVERERELGRFERCIIVNFKDERAVCLYRFEQGYILEFQNTEGEISRFSLSRKAMFCLAQIHGLALTPDEWDFEREIFSNS